MSTAGAPRRSRMLPVRVGSPDSALRLADACSLRARTGLPASLLSSDASSVPLSVLAVLMACRKPGPTSDQPISRSGPTASNAAFPYSPATRGSATFSARVTTLAKISSRRAGLSTSGDAPMSARCRVPSRSPRIERSTAGATSGATQAGTPSRRARLRTLPKPNRNVSPTTVPMIAVTARTTVAASGACRVTPASGGRPAMTERAVSVASLIGSLPSLQGGGQGPAVVVTHPAGPPSQRQVWPGTSCSTTCSN
jgi:hypothetical protein